MTEDALAELMALVGVSHRPGPDIEVAALGAAFETPVPPDYVRYVQIVPSGDYQTFLRVLQPAPDGSTDELRAEVAFRREVIRDDGGPDNLVPWAVVQSDAIICWAADGGDPSAWRVAVFDRYGPAVHEFPGTCVEFLRAFVTGSTGIDELGYIHEDCPQPRFDAAPAPQPLGPAELDPAGWGCLRDALDLPMEPVDAGPELLANLDGSGTPTTTDWTAVAARLGSPVPADYRRLVDAGIAGRIGPARLATPGGTGGPQLLELAPQVYGRMLAANAATGGVRGPYHPEPGGLLPFGLLDDGSIMCWNPLDADPDRWPVSVVGPDFRGMATHPLTATAFLLRLLTQPGTFPGHSTRTR